MKKHSALADLAGLVKHAVDGLDEPTPNVPLAKGTLLAILARLGEDTGAADVADLRAKNIPAAAADMGISPKQLRMLIKRGDLDDAIVRAGTSMRGVRVIVPRALEALKSGVVGRGPKDVAEREYEAFRRREQMKVLALKKAPADLERFFDDFAERFVQHYPELALPKTKTPRKRSA